MELKGRLKCRLRDKLNFRYQCRLKDRLIPIETHFGLPPARLFVIFMLQKINPAMKKSFAILMAFKVSIALVIAQPSFTVSEREGAEKVRTNVLAVVLAETEEKTIK